MRFSTIKKMVKFNISPTADWPETPGQLTCPRELNNGTGCATVRISTKLAAVARHWKHEFLNNKSTQTTKHNHPTSKTRTSRDEVSEFTNSTHQVESTDISPT